MQRLYRDDQLWSINAGFVPREDDENYLAESHWKTQTLIARTSLFADSTDLKGAPGSDCRE